ncbi:MAG: ComF family protein [Prevotella sp.]
MLHGFVSWIKGLLVSLADLLFPRYCFVCGSRLAASEGELCGWCVMSRPFAPVYADHRDNDMAKLFMGVMPIERAQAMMRYDPQSHLARVIYELKYYNKPEVGVTMGRLCAKLLMPTGFFDGIDLVVPVPLAKERQRARGYNQSEMIAEGISQATGIEMSVGNVVRLHFSKTQTMLNEWERRENVEGNFKVVDAAGLEGKHVLLVDDIMTTGATLKACGGEMGKSVGKLRISVLTIGRSSD